MTQRENPFNWIDELLKRWQIWLVLAGSIVWVTTMQIQVNAETKNQDEMKSQIDSFSSIKTEMPYLREKVENVSLKVDKLDSKIDQVLLKLK